MISDPRATGFTLVEVLVALAVVVVAFLAMYGGMQQVVRGTSLMQDKTFASWVAYDRLAELRLEGSFPDAEQLEDETEMAGVRWRHTATINATGSEDIRQVIVRVAPAEQPELIVAEASGVLVRQSGTGAPAAAGSNPNFGNSGAALIAAVTPGERSDEDAPPPPEDEVTQ